MDERRWSGPGWSLDVASDVTGTYQTASFQEPAADVDLERRWWWLWQRLQGPHGETLAKLKRASADDVRDIEIALSMARFRGEVDAAVRWARDVDAVFAEAVDRRRWITCEQRDALVAVRPPPGLAHRLEVVGLTPHVSAAELGFVQLLDADLERRRAQANAAFVASERSDAEIARFLAEIERSPLTDEQARAVLTMDNRVQLLAAAGSGKTSVMVARAGYAVKRGIVSPERILLLAFNRDAARELGERISSRMEAAGLVADGITASTFHSFGLRVLGEATGKKPRLAPWLDSEREAQRKAMDLVDELRDADLAFRLNWDLFRTVFGPAGEEVDSGTPDRWDRDRKQPAFATFAGHSVLSEGERMIADWLFLSGVDYRYEAPYLHDTRDAQHGQYRPDFHYPSVDVWHEHWALDRDGKPPAAFEGYLDGIAWKRSVHAHHGTTLVESTWADVVAGDGLQRLQVDLEAHGLEFDFNPDRPPVDQYAKPIEHESLLRLMRSFMSHVKANGLDEEETRVRAAARGGGGRPLVRTRLFLDAYWAFHRRWQQELDAAYAIDFDDMLAEAADVLEAGFEPGYEMVLVDEFQDTSRVRARIAAALVAPPGRYLLAVGDDWQSINRFAGSDVGVMAEFTEMMGEGPQIALTRTFRCPQVICDVASTFVAKNPSQLSKAMRAANGRVGPPIRLVGTDDAVGSLEAALRDIADGLAEEERASVFLLVRFWFLGRDEGVQAVIRRAPAKLDVKLSSVHGSKGLEADHVIVLGVGGGKYGFPSDIEDDPVLELAMPAPDPHEHAEERRLFYVALTRAREQVTLITDRTSPFVTELLDDDPDPSHILPVGFTRPIRVCPECGKGTLQEKAAKTGAFLSCTMWPACGHTEPIRPDAAEDCPEADCSGWLEQRRGRNGPFLGCSEYRVTGCRGSRDIIPDGAETCPRRCGGHLVRRKGRNGPFWGCSNFSRGDCRYTRNA